MSKTKSVLTFIFGAAAGSAATFIFVKNYYERITQEEIASVKEVFSKKREKEAAEAQYKPTDKDVKKNDDIIDKRRYDIQSDDEESALEKKYGESYYPEPYVIFPDEFGSEDYEEITLVYYDDMILTDEDDEPVEDVDGTVGYESLGEFEKRAVDILYVRNDRLECDFEILHDPRKYSDVIKNGPPIIGR